MDLGLRKTEDKRMHIVKELIDNISSTSLNRFLTEQKIANEQRLSFSDQRVLLDQLCQSGLISVEDLNDFFFQELLYGHHRLMRVYSLTASTCLRLKSRDSWGRLMRKFQIPDWTYNLYVKRFCRSDRGGVFLSSGNH